MLPAMLFELRRFFLYLLILLLCPVILHAGTLSAQTATPVVRAEEKYNAVVGTYEDISIFVSNAPGMAGFQFDLRYDPEIAVIKVRPGASTAVKLGDFFVGPDPIVNMNYVEEGLIRVAWMDLQEEMGSGEICRISFEIRSTGTTPLTLSRVELVNMDGVIGQDDPDFEIDVVHGLITSEAELDVDVSGVSIPGGNRNLVEGETKELTAEIDPPNATNREVSWNSSDTDVATVNANGLITAVGEGTAEITVTTADGGYKDTITVTVRPSGVIIEAPRQLPHAYRGRYYEYFLDARGENDSFSWSRVSGSLPPGLRLSSAGRIYGTPTGTGRYDFTIRATDADGNEAEQDFVLWVAETDSPGYDNGIRYPSDWGAFKNLNINHGSLEMDLQPHELPHTMVVGRNTTNVKIQVSLIRSSDRLRINGTLRSANNAHTVSLLPRNNVITISIHPSYGDPRHYTITIYRIP